MKIRHIKEDRMLFIRNNPGMPLKQVAKKLKISNVEAANLILESCLDYKQTYSVTCSIPAGYKIDEIKTEKGTVLIRFIEK